MAEKRGPCALLLADGIELSDTDREVGFRWLGTWDVAMPMMPYRRLAHSFGDDEERAMTKALVGNLHQPVYDERVMFVRDGSTADALLKARKKETCKHEDCPLPMLRAIWKIKPLLLALPNAWVQEEEAA